MLNYIWSFMIIISVICAAIAGNLDSLATEALSGAKNAITVIISLTGAMCFWSGILNVAEKSGLTESLSKLLHPIIRLLFPSVSPKSAAANAIVSNMSANMLGMGNAATPFGLKAISELSHLNGDINIASDAMCMFVVINTASIQLIPSTMISILSANGSKTPFEIMLPTLIVSFISLLAGTLMCLSLSKSVAGRWKRL